MGILPTFPELLVSRQGLRKQSPVLIKRYQVHDHQRNPVGPKGVHHTVVRELRDVIAKTLSIIHEKVTAVRQSHMRDCEKRETSHLFYKEQISAFYQEDY